MSMNRKGFWRALERLTPGAVMAEWTRELDGEMERARPFLRLSAKRADTFPCLRALGCGLPHRVEEHEPGQWVALCDPGESCLPFRVETKDLLVFDVDTGRLCSGIAQAMGLGPAPSRQIGRVRAVPVGTIRPANAGVYLMYPGDSARMAREVERLFGAQPDPFILLTPTGLHCSPEVQSALRRQGCMHIPLSESLVLKPGGTLTLKESADGMFAAFGQRLAAGPGLVKTVERIDRNIEAVARDKYELRKENEELKQLQAEGFFKFALRVDGEDFRAFAVIMALGNRKAAADFLELPHRSFYDRVEKWDSRGKDYQRMFRLIEWRKTVGRKIKVRLEDSVQSGEPNDSAENPETVGAVLNTIATADNRDYPEIMRQILEALMEQNPQNWASVREEVVGILREEVG